MTRDELREKVAECIAEFYLLNKKDADLYRDVSDDILDTIFAALKEPTEEMQHVWAFGKHQETARDDWQAMLSASTLAPEKEE